MNGPKLRAEVKTAWLEALRSGQYAQATGHLHVSLGNDVDGYCCLGVLCDLAVDQGVVGRGEALVGRDNFGNPVYAYTGGRVEPVATAMPPQEVADWAYIEDSGCFDTWMVTDRDGDVRQLSELNDDQELTFVEIADLIEKDL